LSLHIIEALLLWLALSRLQILGGFLAALLFAVHPVNVGSVAWIAELKNLVAMLFFLLTILAYLKFDAVAELPASKKLWYGLSLALFVLALLGKGSVAVLPPLLLVVLWWRRGLTVRDLLLSLPFFAAAIAFTFVNIQFQIH